MTTLHLDVSIIDLLTIADSLVERAQRRVTDEAEIKHVCDALRAIGYDESADAVLRYRETMAELMADHSVRV